LVRQCQTAWPLVPVIRWADTISFRGRNAPDRNAVLHARFETSGGGLFSHDAYVGAPIVAARDAGRVESAILMPGNVWFIAEDPLTAGGGGRMERFRAIGRTLAGRTTTGARDSAVSGEPDSGRVDALVLGQPAWSVSISPRQIARALLGIVRVRVRPGGAGPFQRIARKDKSGVAA